MTPLKITFTPVRRLGASTYQIVTRIRTQHEHAWGWVYPTDATRKFWTNSKDVKVIFKSRLAAARDLVDRGGL